jgi:hypothetical protein
MQATCIMVVSGLTHALALTVTHYQLHASVFNATHSIDYCDFMDYCDHMSAGHGPSALMSTMKGTHSGCALWMVVVYHQVLK